MSDTVEVLAHKFEAGHIVWMRRDDLAVLAHHAYFFEAAEYDGDYVRVTITGHADAPLGEADSDE